jgi:hypothetical protein
MPTDPTGQNVRDQANLLTPFHLRRRIHSSHFTCAAAFTHPKSLARCRPHSPHSAAFPCLHPRFDDLRLGRRGSGVGRCTGGGRLLLVRGVKRRSWPVLGTRRRHHGEGFTVLEFSSVSPSSLILRVSVFSCGSAHARISSPRDLIRSRSRSATTGRMAKLAWPRGATNGAIRERPGHDE